MGDCKRLGLDDSLSLQGVELSSLEAVTQFAKIGGGWGVAANLDKLDGERFVGFLADAYRWTN